MTTDRETQIAFFKWLEETKSQLSLVNELIIALEVSKDSAYRRIRGQTLLTFNEIAKISTHFQVSLDAYLRLNTKDVVFQSRTIGEDLTFHDYLQSISDNLSMIRQFKEPLIYCLAKDIPVFYHFQFPTLTSFKIFFWLRTIIKDPQYQVAKYDPTSVSGNLLSLAAQIADQFVNIPSVEIWSEETINITVRQISYYFESHVLGKQDALDLIDELLEMLVSLERQAEQGRKMPDSVESTQAYDSFQLYYNEVEIGDNTIFFSMDDKCMVFKTYNMLNLLATSDPLFCTHTQRHIHRIMEKSIAISHSAEKERIRVFNLMRQKVLALKSMVLQRAELTA